jgi:hypothetical protein
MLVLVLVLIIVIEHEHFSFIAKHKNSSILLNNFIRLINLVHPILLTVQTPAVILPIQFHLTTTCKGSGESMLLFEIPLAERYTVFGTGLSTGAIDEFGILVGTDRQGCGKHIEAPLLDPLRGALQPHPETDFTPGSALRFIFQAFRLGVPSFRIVFAGDQLDADIAGQPLRLLQAETVFLLRVDIGIIKESRHIVFLFEYLDDVGGAPGTAQVQ